MSEATLMTRPHGGPTRAAVSFPLYFRIPRRSSPMIPDPATHPVMTAEEAFVELGIDRSTGYKAIRDGTFPVPIIRVGRSIRVPTAALRRVLQIDTIDDDAKGATL
jgi:hypothetical protein